MKKFKGFTLIELLIVIAIIGILAGVLFSAFTSTQQRAKDTKALELAKNMQTAGASCRTAEASVQTWSDPNTGGGNLCSLTGVDSTTWVTLAGTNWTYSANTVPNPVNDFAFSLGSTQGGTKSISCTLAGCTKVGF